MVPFFYCLFWYFSIYIQISHSYNTYIHLLPVSSLLIAYKLSKKKPPWVVKPRIELGPALKQADALLYWATPYTNWSTPHPTELRHRIF